MNKREAEKLCRIQASNLGVTFLEIESIGSYENLVEIEWAYLEEGQEISDILYV